MTIKNYVNSYKIIMFINPRKNIVLIAYIIKTTYF